MVRIEVKTSKLVPLREVPGQTFFTYPAGHSDVGPVFMRAKMVDQLEVVGLPDDQLLIFNLWSGFVGYIYGGEEVVILSSREVELIEK